MSIFSKFFDALKGIWNAIKTGLNDLSTLVKEMLPYIIIIAAILMIGTGGGFILFGVLTISGVSGALMLMGAAFLLLPAEMEAALTGLATSLADTAAGIIEAATPIITAAGEAIGAGFGSLLSASGLGTALLLGAAFYFFVVMDDDKKDDDQSRLGVNYE